MVRRPVSSASQAGLARFFDGMVGPAFGLLGLRDESIVKYVVDLLVRFARMDQLHRIRGAKGESLSTIAALLMELSRQWEPEVPYKIDRELEIRRHCGDYALFMSGLFRPFVEGRSLLTYYLEEGRHSYHVVAELKQMAFAGDAVIYGVLAKQFEHLSGGLDYVRKVHLAPHLNRGEYGELLSQMGF